MKEVELALRARGGDEVAFQRLISNHLQFIHWLMGRYYQQGSDPDDLRQEIKFGLFKAVRDYKPGVGSFPVFARLCMQRQAITAVKKGTQDKALVLSHSLRWEQPVRAAGDQELGEVVSLRASSRDDPHLHAQTREELTDLIAAVGTLTELEHAGVIGLAEGRSYEEIAESQGVNQKAVDNGVQRGWGKISRHMRLAA